eukprot:421329-Pelagomonas_calceolata.AAC.3
MQHSIRAAAGIDAQLSPTFIPPIYPHPHTRSTVRATVKPHLPSAACSPALLLPLLAKAAAAAAAAAAAIAAKPLSSTIAAGPAGTEACKPILPPPTAVMPGGSGECEPPTLGQLQTGDHGCKRAGGPAPAFGSDASDDGAVVGVLVGRAREGGGGGLPAEGAPLAQLVGS